MKVNSIRKLYIDFFKSKNHQMIESAPLVPIDDPTLLWINAGIAPLKSLFDGSVVPQHKRLVGSQKCIRTNDIENVGHTSRHHTFFEMLGNFSIGDYFKKEAIEYAFEFLTSEKWLGFDKDNLYITVYPTDVEAYNYWIDLGINSEKIIKLEYNFWEIGDGPCGPCSEIFYDRGENYDKRGIELIIDDVENDRYIEIWNLVFSQFNAKSDEAREQYQELPNKNIDTGMGLERVASIIQNVDSNFEIDAFMSIIKEISKLSEIEYNGQLEFKIISDHIRTLCAAINDSAIPSNEGRGYVLRRLLRRALKHGKKLGFHSPFMYKLVDVVAYELEVYNIDKSSDLIKSIIKSEEEKFYKTLDKGEKKLEELIKDDSVLSGKNAFLLYDTYGFPIELTVEMADEYNMSVDVDKFYELMEEAKNRSRESRANVDSLSSQEESLLKFYDDSSFIGYDNYSSNSKIIAILKDNELVEKASGEIDLILDSTPFYAESGGQVSDVGIINDIEVVSVRKAPHGQHLHHINTSNVVSVNDTVNCKVDENFRSKVVVNHSSTHILNYVLKKYFGQHVNQQGSYVTSKYLRFDFNHFEKVTDEDMQKIEDNVNELLNSFSKISIDEMSIEKAKEIGAVAQFGEKYDDIVRVVTLGDSIELCGGCHVKSFDEIARFAIVSYESKGSGIYRIEASTNNSISSLMKDYYKNTLLQVTEKFDRANTLLSNLNDTTLSIDEYEQRFESLNENSFDYAKGLKELNLELTSFVKELDKLVKKQKASNTSKSLDFEESLSIVNDIRVVVTKVVDIDLDTLKTIIDEQFEKYKLDLIFIANIVNDKVIFLSKASDKSVGNSIHCGNLVKQAAQACGGNGGGRPNFAQAGGNNIEKVDEAINAVHKQLKVV